MTKWLTKLRSSKQALEMQDIFARLWISSSWISPKNACAALSPQQGQTGLYHWALHAKQWSQVSPLGKGWILNKQSCLEQYYYLSIWVILILNREQYQHKWFSPSVWSTINTWVIFILSMVSVLQQSAVCCVLLSGKGCHRVVLHTLMMTLIYDLH